MTIQVTPLKQYLENIQVLAPDKTEKQVQELFKTIILENVDFNGNEEMLTFYLIKPPILKNNIVLVILSLKKLKQITS